MTLEAARNSAKRIQSLLGDKIESVFEDRRGVVIRTRIPALIEVMTALKNDETTPFSMLMDVSAVDWSTWQQETGLTPPPGRFSVYYVLYSIESKVRIFVEVNIKEAETVPTATGLWASADWGERETYDMFGIRFDGHPDLRRILMTEEFDGYPMRKEFPINGRNPQDFPQE